MAIDSTHVEDTEHPKRPRDMNELAKHIVDVATGETEDFASDLPDSAASKRGDARAAALSSRRRKAIAKKAAEKRWHKGP